MNEEEMIIEVDRENNVLGLRRRGDFVTERLLHRSVHLFLRNSNGEFLTQHRSPAKEWEPDVDEFACSGTMENESLEEGIAREMQEELDISLPCKKLATYYFESGTDRGWRTVFLAEGDVEVHSDPEEVTSVRWVKKRALLKEIEEHPERFAPHFSYAFKKFFEQL